MYFPYFRGKQYEWIAVRELSETIANTKGHFFYFPKYVEPSFTGPTIPSPREFGKDKVIQKNIDMIGRWKYEIN